MRKFQNTIRMNKQRKPKRNESTANKKRYKWKNYGRENKIISVPRWFLTAKWVQTAVTWIAFYFICCVGKNVWDTFAIAIKPRNYLLESILEKNLMIFKC